jgi:hypothetical protein
MADSIIPSFCPNFPIKGMFLIQLQTQFKPTCVTMAQNHPPGQKQGAQLVSFCYHKLLNQHQFEVWE